MLYLSSVMSRDVFGKRQREEAPRQGSHLYLFNRNQYWKRRVVRSHLSSQTTKPKGATQSIMATKTETMFTSDTGGGNDATELTPRGWKLMLTFAVLGDFGLCKSRSQQVVLLYF